MERETVGKRGTTIYQPHKNMEIEALILIGLGQDCCLSHEQWSIRNTQQLQIILTDILLSATHCSKCFICSNLQQAQRVEPYIISTFQTKKLRHFERLQLDPAHIAGKHQSWGSDLGSPASEPVKPPSCTATLHGARMRFLRLHSQKKLLSTKQWYKQILTQISETFSYFCHLKENFKQMLPREIGVRDRTFFTFLF